MRKTTETNALGTIQEQLEAATRELKSAQSAYLRSLERLQKAEQAHETATLALVEETNTLRAKTKVVSIKLR